LNFLNSFFCPFSGHVRRHRVWGLMYQKCKGLETSNFPRRITVAPITVNYRKASDAARTLGTGCLKKLKKNRTSQKLSRFVGWGAKSSGDSDLGLEIYLGSPSSIVRTKLRGSRLHAFAARGRRPRACPQIFANLAPAMPKFGGRTQFEKAMWAMWIPTIPEVFAKNLPFLRYKNSRIFTKFHFFELGEFPTTENFLIDGANVGHMWTKFQPDRSILWGFMAVWSFRSHWP